MAKVGKLTKLKSALKRWPSLTKHHQTADDAAAAAAACSDVMKCNNDLHTVYVGKSRRRYCLSSDIIQHPLFQELVDRSRIFDDNNVDQDFVIVACEVVLFEHLLWMLKNTASHGGSNDQLGSMEELADFYTY